MQELIQKKREIIGIFMKKGVLVSSEFLNEVEDYEHMSRILQILESKDSEKLTVISSDLGKLVEEAKEQTQPDTAKEQEIAVADPKEKIRIISNYKEEPKKRDTQDFVDYFNNRYKALEKILKQHQELTSTISINKILSKKDKETNTIIGIVNDKRVTKNGNLLMVLEDPTGQIKVLVNNNNPQLFKSAKDVVLDEVIGVVGVNVGTFIFATNIIWPDTPTNKDLKKTDQGGYALFLSDLHVGSSKFLPEDFEKFLKWINGEMGNEQQKEIANNVKYIFIAGDLVDGCGIYPGQEKELAIKDIYEQYNECAKLLSRIPKRIPLVICPGNHDALRLSEPQPQLSKNFAKPMHELSNVVMVSNPSIVNIGFSEGFEGFDVLMYHGYSFDYFIAHVDSLRNQGGYDRADLIMKFLLKRRHLAPTHTSTLYIPDTKNDPLVIDKVPDFFLSGHIHKLSTSNYRNTTMICGSCWQGKTLFQEKVGHNPEPSRVPIVNLRTRDIKILKFGQ